uniref:Uncharacterized protein n=1 Tax=Arundo donax TaxID=35708 RepID=A0A0A8ZSD4_ARUDO
MRKNVKLVQNKESINCLSIVW